MIAHARAFTRAQEERKRGCANRAAWKARARVYTRGSKERKRGHFDRAAHLYAELSDKKRSVLIGSHDCTDPSFYTASSEKKRSVLMGSRHCADPSLFGREALGCSHVIARTKKFRGGSQSDE
ncbi:hypothetical protein AMTR_s00054p00169710 [Amborella trichopoda]|uniref:Uncharacterized protein n=1 Tax=Amborella trichopoda TaxID=13333 RepID=U5DCP5_AMBTC|nr:hypothetical protein AMTR_s00054p00169710 [Amborella trichopoda]